MTASSILGSIMRLCVPIAILAPLVLAPDQGFAAAQSGSSEVALETTPRRTMVIVNHVGPYWGVAARIQSVRAHMEQLGLSGPVFIRYAADPTRRGGLQAQMEIGFLVDRPPALVSPFRMVVWEPELVAIVRETDSKVGLPQICRRLRDWAKTHDLVPSGSVMEVFSGLDSPRAGIRGVTVQMAVQPLGRREPGINQQEPRLGAPDPAAVSGSRVDEETPADHEPAVGAGGSREAKEGAFSKKTKGAGPTAKSEDREEPHPGLVPPGIPTPMADRSPNRQGDLVATGHEASRSAGPKAPKVVADVESTKPQPQPESASVPVKAEASEPSPSPSQESIVRRLIRPSDKRSTQAERWLGQIVLRVRALARGMKRLYPGQDSAITGLERAIALRYQTLQPESPSESGERAAAFSGKVSESIARQQKGVIRDLDRLMALVGTKSLSVSETDARFLRIISQAAALMDGLSGEEAGGGGS